MKKKRLLVKLFVLLISVFSFIGCAEDVETRRTDNLGKEEEASGNVEKDTEEASGDAEKEPEETTETAEAGTERREIPIDFPFYGDQENHRLVLAAPEEGQSTYTLIYYNEDGKILQQIFCGNLTEPVTFSFDGLAYGSWSDLQIFSEGSNTGLLFLWEGDLFSETPIGIPRYEESRGTAMLTVTEEDGVCEKEIYLLNEDRNRSEKARSYKLQKETGMLTIWDELEKRYIFEGTVQLGENGNPLNEEYVDLLLWSELPLLYDYTEEDTIYTWIGEETELMEEGEAVEIDSYEDMQYYLYGNSGHMEQYESRQAFLADFGYENSEPIYQYFGQNGNLQLELFADEDRERMCGIVHSDMGFTLCSFTEAKWNGGDPYTLCSVYGTTGEEDENVKDYEKNIEYTAFGKPDIFVSRGRVEGWSGEDTVQDILRINFFYREDGTLYYREYYHTHQVFGTTLQKLVSYYDGYERVIYERGYITHGALEYYYIYEDRDGKIVKTPTYTLMVDNNMGYAIPYMIKWH